MRPPIVPRVHNDGRSEVLERLYRRRWIALAVLVAAAVAAGAYVAGLPHVYRARATLLVQSANPLAVTGAPAVTEARLQSIKQVALSRARLTELVEQFDLYPDLRETSLEPALARLQRDIHVEASAANQTSGSPETIAFTVSYVSGDPQTAADVANAIASFYVAQNDLMRSQQATRATELLAAQVADARKALDRQLARQQAYISRNAGALPQQLDANLVALQRLDGQLRAMMAEQGHLLERRQTLQNELAALATADDADADPATRLAQLQSRLTALRSRVSDKHPDVRQTQAAIETLERQIAAGSAPGGEAAPHGQRAALQKALDETNARLEKLAGERRSLQAQLASHESRVERSAMRSPEFQAITSDVQAARELFDALQRRHNEAQLVEMAGQDEGREQFRILDAAVRPTAAAAPNRSYLLLLALVFGFGAALGTAALVDRFDTSFHSVQELRRFARVPVLASVPYIPARRSWLASGARAAAVGGAMLLIVVAVAAGAFAVGSQSEGVVRLLLRLG